MAHDWTSQETGYLKRYADTKTLNELTLRFEVEANDIRSKLKELGLKTKDGEPVGTFAPDPMVGPFEDGLKALYGKKWAKAAEHFEKVIAESDQPELTARAQQLLLVAKRHTDDDGNESTPYLDAVWAKNNGDLDEAMKIIDAQKKDGEGRFAYLAASIHAVGERAGEAAKALEKATESDPRHRVHAYHDPDFAELRKDKDYAHLFGMD